MLSPSDEEKSNSSAIHTQSSVLNVIGHSKGDESVNVSLSMQHQIQLHHSQTVERSNDSSNQASGKQDIHPSSRYSNRPIFGKVIVSWSSIVNKFAEKFEKVFVYSKKAHFDSLPKNSFSEDKVVDGARSKWCIPLMLDAIIFFLEHNAFDLSRRRSFNQHRVLYECIWETIVEVWATTIFHETSHIEAINEEITISPFPTADRTNENTHSSIDNPTIDNPTVVFSRIQPCNMEIISAQSTRISMIQEILHLRQTVGALFMKTTNLPISNSIKKIDTQVSTINNMNTDMNINQRVNNSGEEFLSILATKTSLPITDNCLKPLHLRGWQQMSEQESHQITQCIDQLSHMILLDDSFQLPSPWDNLQFLQESILKNETASKSSRKLSRILSSLCQHEVWQGRQTESMFLVTAYRQVILHAILYFHNYVPLTSGSATTLKRKVTTNYKDNDNNNSNNYDNTSDNNGSSQNVSIYNYSEDNSNANMSSNIMMKPNESTSSSQLPLPWFVPLLNSDIRDNFLQSIWPCLLSTTSVPSTSTSSLVPYNTEKHHNNTSRAKLIAKRSLSHRYSISERRNLPNSQHLNKAYHNGSTEAIGCELCFNTANDIIANNLNNDTSNGNNNYHDNNNNKMHDVYTTSSSSMVAIYDEHLLLATDSEEDAPTSSCNATTSDDVFHSIATVPRHTAVAASRLFPSPPRLKRLYNIRTTVPNILLPPITVPKIPAISAVCPPETSSSENDDLEPPQKRQKTYSYNQNNSSSFMYSPNSAFAPPQNKKDNFNVTIYHMADDTIIDNKIYNNLDNSRSNSEENITNDATFNCDEALIYNSRRIDRHNTEGNNVTYTMSQDTAVLDVSTQYARTLHFEYYPLSQVHDHDLHRFESTNDNQSMPDEDDQSVEEEELPVVSP